MGTLFELSRSLSFWICNIALLVAVHERNIYVNMTPVFNTSITATTFTQTDKNFSEALMYMTKYGYIRSPGSMITYTDLINTIKEVQLMLHVNQTGVLDNPTLLAMRRPRCGVKDIPEKEQSGGKGARNRRYILYWNKWNKHTLTYRIENYPSRNSRITRAQVDSAVHRATQKWSNVTNLKFKKVTGYADLRLSFGSYDHGDDFSFDGPDGTVGHAFVPNGEYGDLDGDIHFDNSEKFTWEGNSGYNFYQVVLHELGHSLGLEHSWHWYAVMYPSYSQGYVPNYTLTIDDIRGIQLLYGQTKPDLSLRLLRPNAPCNIAYGAAGMVNGELYIFKDKRFWRIKGEIRMTPRKGKPLKRRFKGLPSNIDAIYQLPFNGHIYIFKGKQYWVYRNKRVLDDSYPRSVTDFGLPDVKIDAAFIMDRFNKTYFFSDWQVWRYDEGTQEMDEGWPHYISNVWAGIPYPISAAFDYTDGHTYFVTKKKYFKFSRVHKNADPGYPRYFGQDWIGC